MVIMARLEAYIAWNQMNYLIANHVVHEGGLSRVRHSRDSDVEYSLSSKAFLNLETPYVVELAITITIRNYSARTRCWPKICLDKSISSFSPRTQVPREGTSS